MERNFRAEMEPLGVCSWHALPLFVASRRAALALKPPRPAILAALRSPDSASGLARRLELSRQRLNVHGLTPEARKMPPSGLRTLARHLLCS